VEPWLRGPIAGIHGLLQPAGHAFVAAREEAAEAVSNLSESDLWIRPGGAASPGFHLLHLAGSTDRLLTYARGESLSREQRERLAAEERPGDPPPSRASLLEQWDAAVERALAQLASTAESDLLLPRTVGRSQLPSTVIGLIFHAAEHAQRHSGQLVTTAKMIRGVPQGAWSLLLG
jgi:hypothetical protein